MTKVYHKGTYIAMFNCRGNNQTQNRIGPGKFHRAKFEHLGQHLGSNLQSEFRLSVAALLSSLPCPLPEKMKNSRTNVVTAQLSSHMSVSRFGSILAFHPRDLVIDKSNPRWYDHL